MMGLHGNMKLRTIWTVTYGIRNRMGKSRILGQHLIAIGTHLIAVGKMATVSGKMATVHGKMATVSGKLAAVSGKTATISGQAKTSQTIGATRNPMPRTPMMIVTANHTSHLILIPSHRILIPPRRRQSYMII